MDEMEELDTFHRTPLGAALMSAVHRAVLAVKLITLYTTKTSSQLDTDLAVCQSAVFGFYGLGNLSLCPLSGALLKPCPCEGAAAKMTSTDHTHTHRRIYALLHLCVCT